MDRVHDLGGFVGFGAVRGRPGDDEVFSFDWERRAFGMTFVSFVRGLSNGGEFRHSIERMEPGHYLTTRYYEHWFTSVASRLVETGVLDLAGLEAKVGGTVPLSSPVHAAVGRETAELIEAEEPTLVANVGDRVRVVAQLRVGHTRCPSFVRGRTGTVVRVDPPASLADLEAHSDERRSETIYCVKFAGRDLWGSTAEDAFVHVDLWASYLALEELADA